MELDPARSTPHDAAPWAADVASATVIARRYLGEKGRSPAELARRRRADALLYVELGVQIAVTYVLVYGPIPRPIAALLLTPWSIYSALSVDNVIHYTNHWSPSKSAAVNVALRALFLPLLVTPLEIRHVHWEHHKYNDIEVDQRTWMRSIACRARGARASVFVYAVTEVWSSLRASVPWAKLAPPLERLREKRPLHHLEIRAVRWICLVWLAGLVALRPLDTLCLFVPAVVVVPLFASLLMNLTDHLPSTLTHPFRQATYLEPSCARERLYAAVNRQSAATHLTHHLFPQVHWTELRDLQRELAPIYEKHGAPRSLLHSSWILGNWVDFLGLFARISRVCRASLGDRDVEK